MTTSNPQHLQLRERAAVLIYNRSVNLGSLTLGRCCSVNRGSSATMTVLLCAESSCLYMKDRAYSAPSFYCLIITTLCPPHKKKKREKEIRIQLMPCNAAKNRARACSQCVPGERTIDEEIGIQQRSRPTHCSKSLVRQCHVDTLPSV